METLVAWLPILGIFLIFWLLLLRPAQRRQKELRNLQARLAVGDRVVTNAGIYGTVTSLEDDKVGLEVADGVVIMMSRGVVSGIHAEDFEKPDQAASDSNQAEQE